MSIGIWQIVLVLVLVLVIFGAGKLPGVMGDLGKGMRNFKDGLKEGESGTDDASPKQIAKKDSTAADDAPAEKEADAVKKDKA
ncbi:MAG: twin-arginine translocase TatA/TatE family subunit [Micavibrio sp.]|nr:MAG: twin-arginine translocase TatA/TatE family subunit [Micavibrio sp.]